MNCCCENKNRIIIVRGNDTNFNGQNFVHFNITSSAWDLSTMKATISLGGITKTFTDLSNGIDLSYTNTETAQMPFGDIDGVLKVYNQEEQIATIESLLPFKVISIVHGDAIAVTPAEFNIEVKQGGETVMNIDIEAGVSVELGNTYTLPAGEEARVENRGTKNHLILDFYIPEGDSIKTIEKTSTEGLVDTYTITFETGKTSTFEVTNGNGIDSIEKISTEGLVDTYQINYTNGTNTTFEVTNGQDGADGKDAVINGVNTLTLNTAYGISLIQEGDTATISGKEITDVVDRIDSLIPAQASESNQLADKNFVNSSIATNTGNFIGTFESITDRDAYSGTITNNDYCFVINSVVTDNGNDWASFSDLDGYDKSLLTNYDYGWVINGSNFDLYRFDIVNQEWELRAENIEKDDVSLNTAYNRYKATVAGGSVTWEYEYTLNNSSFTANQWEAINSGATQENIEQITTNENAIGNLSILTTTDKSSLVGATNELNTKKLDKVTGSTSVMQAYVKNADGTQGMTNIVQNSASGSSIPFRTSSGTIYTAPPTNDGEATNKSYVDTAISSLDSKKIDKGYAVNDFATNCITEIPQDIKLELSNGTLTLKSGSIVTNTDGTQSQLTSDKTITSGSNGKKVVFTNAVSSGLVVGTLSNCCSGATDALAGVAYHTWYDTTNNVIQQYNSTGTVVAATLNLPHAIVTVSNGAITSIDQVFNGFGYIGSTVFALPGVKGLIPAGFNSDGTLKSTTLNNQALRLYTYSSSLNGTVYWLLRNATTQEMPNDYTEAEYNDGTHSRGYYYNDNYVEGASGGVLNDRFCCAKITVSSGRVASLDPKPVSSLSKNYINKAMGLTASKAMVTDSSGNITTSSTTSTEVSYLAGATSNIQTQINAKANTTDVNTALDEKIDKGYAVNDFATNCITEIPQDIKLELSSGTLTLKSGSVLTYPDGTQKTTSIDLSATSSSNGKKVIYSNANGSSIIVTSYDNICSGTTDTFAGTAWHVWYDTTNNMITQYAGNGTSVATSNCSLPFVIITVSNGAITSIDQVFNGVGYIGHHAFILPGVKGLIPDGFNDDGTLKSILATNNALRLVDLGTSGTRTHVMQANGGLFSSGLGGFGYYDTLPTILKEAYIYIRTENLNYRWSTGTSKYDKTNGLFFLEDTVSNEIVTEFKTFPVSGLSSNYIETALGYSPLKDTTVNGTSVVNNGVAVIPIAEQSGSYGLVKLSDANTGLTISNSGNLVVSPASNLNIDGKTNAYKPIVPSTLDYAVKRGVAYNSLTLTDTEKASACSFVGALPNNIYGTSTTAASTVQKEVSIPSITSLNAGQLIIVQPTNTSTVADSTLKLNDFDAYPMIYAGSAITTVTDSSVWNSLFPTWWLFDGSNWVFAGHGTDINTTYSAMSVANIIAGTETSGRLMRSDYLKDGICGVVTAYASGDTITPADKYLYNSTADISALTVNAPDSPDVRYVSQINFSSGTTATTLSVPSSFYWIEGSDDIQVVNGIRVFVPESNHRYTIMIMGDGVGICAIAKRTS